MGLEPHNVLIIQRGLHPCGTQECLYVGSVGKAKTKNSLLFKALVPDSFCTMSHLSLGGRVIDTQLWMSGHGFGLAPACQSTNNVVLQS